MKADLREYDHCDPELSIESDKFQAVLRKDGYIDATIFGGSGYYAQDLSVFEEIPREVARAIVAFLVRHILAEGEDDIYPPLPESATFDAKVVSVERTPFSIDLDE